MGKIIKKFSLFKSLRWVPKFQSKVFLRYIKNCFATFYIIIMKIWYNLCYIWYNLCYKWYNYYQFSISSILNQKHAKIFEKMFFRHTKILDFSGRHIQILIIFSEFYCIRFKIFLQFISLSQVPKVKSKFLFRYSQHFIW